MRLWFIIGLSFVWFGGFAQQEVAEKAAKKAEEYLKRRNYSEAGNWFRKSLAADSSQKMVWLQLGKLAAMNMQEAEARRIFGQVAARFPYEPALKEAFMYLATRELRDGKFKDAKNRFEVIRAAEVLPNVLLNNYIKTANEGLALLQDSVQIEPRRLPAPLNAFRKQYFPALTADRTRLFFTAISDKGDENILTSSATAMGWSEPVPLPETINSTGNEGTCTISADGRQMVFTRCDSKTGCDLYFTEKIGDNWSKPQLLGGEINTPNWESHPSLTADGRRLYFVSDRPHGFGNKDIWMVDKLENGLWGSAKNAGKSINTAKDEIAPFIHANGFTLFFSSNGHPALGGYDLFQAEIFAEKFQKPKNLGYPINTKDDQVSIHITSDGLLAYYSLDTRQQVELYQFELPQPVRQDIRKTRVVQGVVTDYTTGKPLKSHLELVDIQTNRPVGETDSDSLTGEYLLILPEGATYAVHAHLSGYLFDSQHFNQSDSVQLKRVDVRLKPLEKNQAVVLNNLFFDSGKWELRPESAIELKKVVALLQQNPSLKLLFTAHTDDIGHETANQILSDKRAQAVIDFLTTHGCQQSQVRGQGMGERKPMRPNDTQENRQANRRIEMKVE